MPLEQRRCINNICYLISDAQGSVDCPELVAKVEMIVNRFSTVITTNYRRNAFALRSANSFNKLSRNLDKDLFYTNVNMVRRVHSFIETLSGSQTILGTLFLLLFSIVFSVFGIPLHILLFVYNYVYYYFLILINSFSQIIYMQRLVISNNMI